jgi:hypothetical protein
MALFTEKEGYSPIRPRSDHSEGSEEDCEAAQLIPSKQQPSACSRSSGRYLLLGVVFLILSNVVSLFVGGFIGQKTVDLDKQCSEYTVQYCKWLWALVGDAGEPN